MKTVAVVAEQYQPSCDRAARAVQDAGGLPVGDLGCEQAHQLEVKTGFPEAVVEPEGLDGERSPAGAAKEALDGTAVTLTTEMPMAAKTEALTTGSGAPRVRAAKRSVAHEILLAEA
jgi:hypothetical protein